MKKNKIFMVSKSQNIQNNIKIILNTFYIKKLLSLLTKSLYHNFLISNILYLFNFDIMIISIFFIKKTFLSLNFKVK